MVLTFRGLSSRLSLLCALLQPSRSFSSYFCGGQQKIMSTTERRDGTITVAPKNEGDQSALLVISHGLGDSAEGFADFAQVCLL
jgi:hypothetical protein